MRCPSASILSSSEYSTAASGNAFIASAANFFHRKPLVLTVHSLKPKPSRLHRFTLGIADRVLFNSAYTMGQAAAKGYRCRGQVICTECTAAISCSSRGLNTGITTEISGRRSRSR